MSDKPEELDRESYDKLWKEMEAAKSHDIKTGIYTLQVGEHTIGIKGRACGCCLMKLYCQVRDNGMPKEGERFYCNKVCGLDGNWVVTNGVVESRGWVRT